MSEAVKIELTLEKETVEAFFKMISSLAASLSAQMSDKEENEEESNKEEVKEEIPIRINTSNNTTNTNTNNNINNNIIYGGGNTNSGRSNNTNIDTNNGGNGNSIDTNTEVSMDLILSYMAKKGYKFDPNRFYKYYQNNGWKTRYGKDIRDNIYEALDTWAKYEYNKAAKATTPNKVGMGTREERMAAHPFVPTDFNEFAPV